MKLPAHSPTVRRRVLVGSLSIFFITYSFYFLLSRPSLCLTFCTTLVSFSYSSSSFSVTLLSVLFFMFPRLLDPTPFPYPTLFPADTCFERITRVFRMPSSALLPPVGVHP